MSPPARCEAAINAPLPDSMSPKATTMRGADLALYGLEDIAAAIVRYRLEYGDV